MSWIRGYIDFERLYVFTLSAAFILRAHPDVDAGMMAGVGSIWGFRRELAQVDPKMRTLAIACLAGGGAGALLLRITPQGTPRSLK